METMQIIGYAIVFLAGMHLSLGLYKNRIVFDTKNVMSDKIRLGIIIFGIGIEALGKLIELL